MLRGFDVKVLHPKQGRSFLDRLLARHHAASIVSVGVRGRPHGDDGQTSASIAAAHEFGHGVPERPFMRMTFEQRRADLQRLAAGLEKRIIEQDMPVPTALEVLGAAAVGYIRQTIDAGVPPALSPATVARKGSSKTLIDTAQMKGDVTSEVRRGN